ncbi:MAG: hypothetical protein EXS63_05225 [Candidatus Omnitrophica bacterium]|nr:hypothetical protein [Candidatus Omnitrophota bacterium]
MNSISWFIPETRRFPRWQKFDYNRVLPSVWIRCLQFIPYLERQGISCRLNQEFVGTQAAIFLRCFDAPSLARMRKLKQRGLKVFVDTPVNYFSEVQHPAFESDVRKYFIEMASLADGIFCPSRYIQKAGESKGFKTFYFPDAVDMGYFRKKKKDFNLENPVFLWCGNSTKASALNFLAPVIRKHLLKVVIISERKPRMDFPHQFLKWDYRKFSNQLLKADLGIFPRDANNEYDQGHSFFKIGVFLALHIPVAYSPVPSYEEVANPSNSIEISEGSSSSWEKVMLSVKELVPALDFHHNPVTHQYSLSVIGSAYADFLKQVLR